MGKLRVLILLGSVFLLGTIALFQACGGNAPASSGAQSTSPQSPAPAALAVVTYHNDNARTGLNPRETILTPANVNAGQFGKLFSFPVDGEALAQPLYLQSVTVPGHSALNLVFVATEHDSVYAFDADGDLKDPVWKVSFIDPQHGVTTVSQAEVSSTIFPEIGITSTPVIDPATQTIYLEALTKENGAFVQRLHALDLTTGQERPGSPVAISAAVSGKGEGGDGSTLPFDPKLQLQRAALLLASGKIYLAFASHGDTGNYHGWVLAYDAATLRQVGVWNDTPDGYLGGIWMSGGGLSADSSGAIYGVSGNGAFTADTGGRDYSQTFFKLLPDLSQVEDYFTPFNQLALSAVDADLGSGDALLLPDQPGPHPHLLTSAGKEGRIYLIDRDHMGHFQPGDDSQIVQSIPHALGIGSSDLAFSCPAVWNNIVYYVGADGDNLKAFQLTNGQLSTTPVRSSTTYGFHGASPAVSANGTSNGIVWTIETTSSSLHAHNAANVAQELYNSNQNPARDGLGPAATFSVPTVANGKVYVGTSSALVVYGLLK